MSATAHSLIDLAGVGRASVALARWYGGLVATGEADVDELARARVELAALPAQPGPLGRAVRLIVSAGDDASDDEIMAAVGLLCDTASRAAATTTSAPIAAAPGRRRRRRVPLVQPPLPGLGDRP